MLSDIRRTYEEQANKISDWKHIDKNELINLYILHENDSLRDVYLSAIILRYWNAINKYYTSSYKSASIQDCYDWLIHAVLYALKNRKWLDPNNKLYNDPTGPDKVMNRCIASSRLIFYQASNNDVRKINFNLASAEALIEEYGDGAFPSIDDDSLPLVEDPVNDIIIKAFNNKDYFMAFMVDRIAHYDVFDATKDDKGYTYTEFNPKKLARYMRSMDSNYLTDFTKHFKFNKDEVNAAALSCMSLSRVRTKSSIIRNLKLLSKNKLLDFNGVKA